MQRPAIFRFTPGFCLFLAVLTCSGGRLDDRQSSEAAAATVADLQDQLVSGLKVRRPVDLAFIARVIRLVEQDRLPLSMVLSTHQWAYPKTPRPFPYFQRAMRIRAARIGVQL